MDKIEDIKPSLSITTNISEYADYLHGPKRRLFLLGKIEDVSDCDIDDEGAIDSVVDEIIASILKYNREDEGISKEQRKPIIIYINSPGGALNQGLALIDAIEMSKTPVYTVTYGECMSAAFMIFITGHKRFVFPRTSMLIHDGDMLIGGSTFSVHDQSDFSKRVEKEVVRPHVLKYSQMSAREYDKRVREQHYMLPKDALEYRFADKIVDDVDEIL